MQHLFFVRIGSLAEIHPASGEISLPRGCRVIVRTPLGVQLGEIVRDRARVNHELTVVPEQVQILRATSEQDEWLIRRLDQFKRQAVESCRAALVRAGSTATLLDIDHVFDGRTLVLHFLGPVDQIADDIRQEIVRRYEEATGTREFADLLDHGCGPGCGTESGGGCGTGGCSGCALKSSCST